MDDWNVRLRRAVAQTMESLELAGLQQLAPPDFESTEPSPPDAPPSAVAVAEPAGTAGPNVSAASTPERLKLLQDEVAACQQCEELASTRTQTVFGVGNPNADLCFFGEAPGRDEDLQGEPFVGAAGRLLTDIIEKGMKLRREDVYILNVLKCRPPGNRNPEPTEIANCQAYYLRQLEIIRPKFICCLGGFAAHALLSNDLPVGRMRGNLYDFQHGEFNAKVVVTYHPAYLLRSPEEKKKTWADIQFLMGEMGIS